VAVSRIATRRVVYLTVLAVALLVWIAFGNFDAVEAPYVGF
jgi:hypothetical protein